MKVKSKEFIEFVNNLHDYIVKNPQFRKDTSNKSESVIQGEIRPLIVQYLEKYFEKKDLKISLQKQTNHFTGKVKKVLMEREEQQHLPVETIQISLS